MGGDITWGGKSDQKEAIYAEIDAALRKKRLQYIKCMKALDKEFLFNIPQM